MRSLAQSSRAWRGAGAEAATDGRRGVSLVELLVALVLFSIVGGAILRALDRQVRLHSSLLALLESRVQHAATHEILAASLRGTSPAAGDILALTDSAIVFRIPLGGGVSCALGPGRVFMAPDTLSNGQVLTRLHATPQQRDTLWVYDEGPTDATIDDGWQSLPVASAMRVVGGCGGGGVVGGSDAMLPGWRIDVAVPLSATILAGAPVRLTRQGRFSLYRSGSDSWLGFAEWAGGTRGWNIIQPVSGPFLPYDRTIPSASGVAFMPRDDAGLPGWGMVPLGMASVSLATRTRTRVQLRLDGMQRGFGADSLHSLIALRNAR